MPAGDRGGDAGASGRGALPVRVGAVAHVAQLEERGRLRGQVEAGQVVAVVVAVASDVVGHAQPGRSRQGPVQCGVEPAGARDRGRSRMLRAPAVDAEVEAVVAAGGAVGVDRDRCVDAAACSRSRPAC